MFRKDAYSKPAVSPISVEWRLVDNLPDSRYLAELRLTNESSVPLDGGWALYFNSGSRLHPDSVTGDFALAHINGDFFVVRPNAGATPIGPGESRRIEWHGGPWAINVTDAPSGFYFIPDDQATEPITIPLPVSIAPFPAAEKLHRGAADVVRVVTAESRYRANEGLRLLPAESLNKVVPTPHETTPLGGQVVLRSTTVIRHDAQLATEAELLAGQLEPLLGTRLETVNTSIKTALPVPQVNTSINTPLPVPQEDTSSKTPLPVPHRDRERSFDDTIRLRVGDVHVGGAVCQPGDEAYRLHLSTENGVEIVGSDPAGVFYGIQTLRALLPLHVGESYVDAVRIADRPRFRYRGVHLDVARNFHPKETVKKLLDLMAFYKLNRFHWHLTDDEGWRIEIRALPELTEVGGRRGHTRDEADCLIPSLGSGPVADPGVSRGSGYYSQEDVVEILRYAQARHIAVIPELDFPGHARAAIKAMEARQRRLIERGDAAAADAYLLCDPADQSRYESVQMWRDNVVDVGRESTYRFLSTVVGEVVEMYQRAGVPLVSIHVGGDEVPNGAWEKSPACNQIPLKASSKIPLRGQLELHFLNRASELLSRHSIQSACWDDCLLWELSDDPAAGKSRRAAMKPVPTTYVWNNVWGSGREDTAYRLANAGFDVVLCNATHLYFDLACEKDPAERGYYWAGFVDARAPFALVPLDVFKNAEHDGMGCPVSEQDFANRTRLSDQGVQHILGIQGQLWSENLRSDETLETMAFPRLIALAERAWAKSPDWAEIENTDERRQQLDADWNQFASRLGQRELPRLDAQFGGVLYRLPPPGAKVQDGHIHANVAYPGLAIRYTTDGSEPNAASPLYEAPIPADGTVKLKSFDTCGRGSRTVAVATHDASAGH